MVGRTVSHYRIDAQLGAGGMGVVYRAEDIRLGRAVALKFLSDDLVHDPEAVRRLRAEARAASALNHGGICTIYDIDEVDGHPFIVMELLRGHSLRDMLVNAPLKVHQLVDIGIEIADALQAAHSEGIVHRDITPANIFVTDQGHVKILDFGLAKLASFSADPSTTVDTTHRTAKGITLGTVAYMSPEQATGEELDGRTDLFSTGVVLYECATGRHPFPGKTSPVILAAILNRAPVAAGALNPDLPLHLQEVINNCLEKDRELRYQSAGDLRADLKRVRRDLDSGQSRLIGILPPDSPGGRAVTPHAGTPSVGIPARDSGASPSAEPVRRRTGALIVGSALAVALLGFAAFKLWTLWSSRPSQQTTTAIEAARPPDQPTPPAATIVLPSPSEPRPSEIVGSAGRGRTSERPSPREVERTSPTARVPSQPAEPPRPSPSVAPPPAPGPAATDEPDGPTRGSPSAQPPPAPSQPPPAAQALPVAPPVIPQAQIPATAGALDRGDARPPREDDDVAIRRAVAAYGRAIETKDLGLFRSIKPNLSRDEERRLEEGFRAVSSQKVQLTVMAVDRRGDEATVRLKRRDTIEAAGRTQTIDSDQTLQLTRAGAGWVVIAIR
jgi:serine/threonine protein kinase